MRQVQFLEPKADLFVQAIEQYRQSSGQPIYLVGDDPLSEEISVSADNRNLSIERIAFDQLNDDVRLGMLVLTEASGESLGRQLLSCVGRRDIVLLAPITDWHFSNKPLFLISIPKSGTHLVFELVQALGFNAGVELSQNPLGQHWYCVEYTNTHTVARDFFVDSVRRSQFGNRNHPFMRSPALFIYRHPLDILVSEAHYYHIEGKTSFAGWLSELEFEERVERLFGDNDLLGSLRERIGGYLPWLEFSNVISFSYEELVGAAGGGDDAHQLDLIWSIQLKLQVPGSPEDVASRIINTRSATFRSGKIGTYENELPKSYVRRFARQNSDILAALGYSKNGRFSLPVQRYERLSRPIRFSKTDHSKVPINLECGFLGCNLVCFDGRVYAIPMSVGAVDFITAPQAAIDELPSAETLSELKLLLLVGPDQLHSRKEQVGSIGKRFQELSNSNNSATDRNT